MKSFVDTGPQPTTNQTHMELLAHIHDKLPGCGFILIIVDEKNPQIDHYGTLAPDVQLQLLSEASKAVSGALDAMEQQAKAAH